jgi:hypothetical protein
MHARARGFCKKRDLAAGLGGLLVGEGRADGEAGGDSACSSAGLQLVGVLGRGKCSGVLAIILGGLGCSGSTPGLACSNDLCVAVMQVDEVGGGDLREMVDFRGAFAAEIEGWAARERVYGALRGAAQPAWTLRRGLARWRLDWRL